MALPDEQDSARKQAQISRELEIGFAHHKAGRRDRAESFYRKVLRRAPNQVDALHLLGVIAHERGRHEYAIQLISRALAGMPTSREMHSSLGNTLLALGRFDEAAATYRAAIALNPDVATAHCNLAATLLRQGSYQDALESASRAAELMPDLFEAHLVRGISLAAQHRFGEAESACRRALALRPDDAQTLSELGGALNELNRFDEAREYLRRAVGLAPNDALIRYRLSVAEFSGGDAYAGEAACREAISLDPNFAGAWTTLANILRSLGRFDEAQSCARHAIELDPEMARAYSELGALRERVDKESELDRLHRLLNDADRALQLRVDAGFALGRLLDNADRHDEAFQCFARANALYGQLMARAGTRFSKAAFQQQIDTLIKTCTPELYSNIEEQGNQSETPVFVVGMPRSGTSLVEQIAASHSRVSGAGELGDISHISAEIQRLQERGGEETDPGLAHRLADGYIEHLKSLGNGADRVIDKMPDNILHLGLIAVLFPSARIIFCQRDPRDICLSCYFIGFNQLIPWACDLVDCGLRALEIERLVDHWRRVLPLRMLTIDYETLVADLEGESRRLIEFLGLDWEPACLEFYRTERPVVTSSGWQVRQPLYTSSVGRWRRYEKHLAPLLEVLAAGRIPS